METQWDHHDKTKEAEERRPPPEIRGAPPAATAMYIISKDEGVMRRGSSFGVTYTLRQTRQTVSALPWYDLCLRLVGQALSQSVVSESSENSLRDESFNDTTCARTGTWFTSTVDSGWLYTATGRHLLRNRREERQYLVVNVQL